MRWAAWYYLKAPEGPGVASDENILREKVEAALVAAAAAAAAAGLFEFVAKDEAAVLV